MGPIQAAVADGVITFLWVFCVSTLGTFTSVIAAYLNTTSLPLSLLITSSLVAFLVFIFSIIGDAVGRASFNPTGIAAFYAAGLSKDSLISMALRFPAQKRDSSPRTVLQICSNHEECAARTERIKILKAKEPVKGHMVNIVKGLKVYEDIFTNSELGKLSEFINELRLAGRRGELSGETFTFFNKQMKGNKREIIQLGVPLFQPPKEEATSLYYK